MYIHGVPNKISRKALTSLIASLGLDPYRVCKVKILPNAVKVVTWALDTEGKLRIVENEPAVHRLTIEVTDDDE